MRLLALNLIEYFSTSAGNYKEWLKGIQRKVLEIRLAIIVKVVK